MSSRKYIPFILMSVFVFICLNISHAQVLVGTDGLGRILPVQKEVGPLKPDRQVIMFYFLWQGDPSSPTSEKVWDLNELQMNHPEVLEDFDHPGWGGGAGIPGKYYFWGKSIYGYYEGHDYWVHLKNIQLLTDAGVDILVLDATNRLTYSSQVKVLLKAMETVRNQGKNPPKLVFYTNTNSGEGMQEIYNTFYREDSPYHASKSWYFLEEKPLIIGVSAEAKGKDYEAFFTIRESQWPNVDPKPNGWPWIEFTRPQHVYYNAVGEKEIINVSTAQHPNLEASMGGSAFYGATGNWGRSFHDGQPGNPEKDIKYGYNIQEQWDFAIEQDPAFIFVTGWNEWIVGKWRRASGNLKHALFVDQANPEYSRDIEPSSSAGLEDHYYMQLVNNIRRYKGVDAHPKLSGKVTIKNLDDWQGVFPVYSDYTGDVVDRDHRSALSDPVLQYKNKTGRNDFERLKVARDRKEMYFYAKTVSAITPNTGMNWMSLYLNLDRSHETGWLGYEYRVVSGNQLQKYEDEKWVTIAQVKHQVSGNEIMMSLPLKALNLAPDQLEFEFKWSDHMQDEDPLDWYVNGDAAPGGRFNYLVLSE